jgi:S-adenosylmethionine:tRNA ribosyltransferase-isomerase
MNMKTADFFYDLPPELIAQSPLPERSQSRMMIVDRRNSSIRHGHITDLVGILCSGDLLALNDTKVIPARLFGNKSDTGGRVEVLLVEETAPDIWDVLWRASRPPRPGSMLELAGGCIQAEALAPPRNGLLRLRMHYQGNFMDLLEAHGRPPLPPYIKRTAGREAPEQTAEDRRRYQTVYARHPGAVAAPTAGLHFTDTLLNDLAARGIHNVKITLHVGPGTFRPVTCDSVAEHHMESERFAVPEETVKAVKAVKRAGGRVIAVGSTVVRTLETAVGANGLEAGSGRSALFIYPPYRFRVVDAMLTNFHLPASTLLMMVSALAGMDLTRQAYALAVKERYRFYSYGDCMLIL